MNDFGSKIYDAAKKAVKEVYDLEPAEGQLIIETPQDTKLGDYSTSIAMKLSRTLRRNPMEIAEPLVAKLAELLPECESITVARPGFINFKLKQSALAAVINEVIAAGDDYGKNDSGKDKHMLLEWVSANPTGDLHCGHARNAAWGDCICRLMEASGWDVLREFYVNDAGNQIVKLGESLTARYFEYFGKEYPLPEDGYHADDIKEIAAQLAKEEGDKWLTADPKERLAYFMDYGKKKELEKIDRDLKTYRVTMQSWMHETFFYEDNCKRINACLDRMADMGLTYEKDGALWLKTSEILAANLRKAGKSEEAIERLGLKDDVLRRANGFYTYFAADIAYHRNKFAVRGFDKVINIWGADHHGHVARLKGAMDALGLDGEHRLDIVLMQLVKLVRDGEVVRMSKRTGKAISLTDLLDEIPVDACRWFFNAKPDTQMEFDLGLAVREDSENPVYYVQYAYARICTLLKALAAEGFDVPAAAQADLALLTADEEKALIKQLAQYPVVVRLAARDYDPSFINRYLTELAAAFHKFYNACRIKGEAENVLLARLKLADTARAVLKNGMTLIGCSAPEKM